MKITDQKSLDKYMKIYAEEEAKSAAVAQPKLSTIPISPIPYKSGYVRTTHNSTYIFLVQASIRLIIHSFTFLDLFQRILK